MSRNEDFANSLWSDPDFLDLSHKARLVYIWTWTNPRCGMAGIYKCVPAQAALEVGLPEAEILAALDELGEARFAYYVDRVLWVRSRVRHLRQKTQQIATAIKKDLRLIADEHPLKAQFLATYSSHIWLKDAIGDEGQTSLTNPSSAPSSQPSDGHATVYGTGKGTGKGGKGWGVGKGTKSAPKTYAPDPEWQAVRDEHFPDRDVSTIESAAAYLRQKRLEPTVDAIRDLITEPGVGAA